MNVDVVTAVEMEDRIILQYKNQECFIKKSEFTNTLRDVNLVLRAVERLMFLDASK